MTVNVDKKLTDRQHYFTIMVGSLVVRAITSNGNSIAADREILDEAEVRSIELGSPHRGSTVRIHRKKGVQKVLEAIGALEGVVVTEHIVETHDTTTTLVRQAELINITEDIMDLMNLPKSPMGGGCK